LKSQVMGKKADITEWKNLWRKSLFQSESKKLLYVIDYQFPISKLKWGSFCVTALLLRLNKPHIVYINPSMQISMHFPLFPDNVFAFHSLVLLFHPAGYAPLTDVQYNPLHER